MPAPPRGETGAARAGPAPDWPTYPTRPPPPATLRYALASTLPAAGGRPASTGEGRAELAWTRDAAGFALRLSAAPAGRAAREWVSIGGFDAAGLAPARLAERERGRDTRVVDFDRAAARVRFSSAAGERATAPGVQDRWSWIAQLAAIAEGADAAGSRAGATWTLQVAGLRGDLDRWTFRVLDDDAPPPGALAGRVPGRARAPGLLHVLREPERPYDLRVEAWLSPALHHLPAALRLSTPPSGWSLALTLDEAGAPPAAAGSEP